MKVEAALITNNSPYAEVRAVVDNHDDPSIPCSTIRSWVIGLGFSVLLGFINQLFSIRQPNITVMANVAQLLSYPIGKAWELVLPDWGFRLFGTRHSLNPGRFSKKEHMLITIMANVAFQTPYTANIIWTQYLPRELPIFSRSHRSCLRVSRIFQPKICWPVQLPDPRSTRDKPSRLWASWSSSPISGISVILRVASVLGHYRAQWRIPHGNQHPGSRAFP